ncbi:MAG: hypothetical protein H0W71_03805 [Sphingomonas sp.]|nr:hypothetical protein [Sphingomonas sp.]
MTARWFSFAAWLTFLMMPLGPGSAAAAQSCVLCGITPGDSARSDEVQPLEIELETTLHDKPAVRLGAIKVAALR